MPELPEVEVVRRGLQRWVQGRTVDSVEVLHPRAVRRHTAGAVDFAARLAGRRIGTPRRRGKYLWLPVSDGLAVLAHLGMSGQLLVQPQDAPDEKHLRVRIRFTGGDQAGTGSGQAVTGPDQAVMGLGQAVTGPGPEDPAAAAGTELRFVDQRTFGGLSLHDTVPGDPDGLPDVIAHIARDPLDPAFDDAAFHEALRRRRTTIKRALLDQSLISGVGNIYADEALWRSRLHYERPTATFTRPRTAELLGHIRDVMNAALAVGGTSFDSLYVNVNGESGYFERSLDAYGREDEPCRRCGTAVRRRPWMNRSSYFCPRCQRPPRP
ncbi:bifunctional DNA-formamidopyrimidine glycosylase/DNA-(apurinic or apyrimidinic site) lyase [Streptomyces sp. MST-110588]|uniref:bifunctional DNA-formamidopyrimidine glycosylase/DNA-(apurinic or apyrimidinic site) lyase n=1 Tax=Streptomyces sp. MST-110588 TaxID=2833628 RepID=UPI001F5DF831|nr:bifunctional DNA-formamidopyrimidine glycosylase/DNA-(apurinic or apyrimidinic site) lyase [Streptomyces sp. MST-110588]UNO39725.1 bifunctional DNA-formamidopyrimidine glycosylase/DNA-(apurinic or apyrimidinic site) lyase [Streptomyces sp. MST-110588]